MRDFTILSASRKLATAHRADNRASRTHAAEIYAVVIDPDTTLALYLEEDAECREALGEIAGTRKGRAEAKRVAIASGSEEDHREWDAMDAANRVLTRNGVYKSTVGRALCRIRGLDISAPAKGFEDATAEDWATLQDHADRAGNLHGLTEWGKYGGEPENPNSKPEEGPRNDGDGAEDEEDAEAVTLPPEADDIVEAARALYGDGCADSVAGILAYWEEKARRDAEDAEDAEEDAGEE
jgi:hypothetical protein